MNIIVVGPAGSGKSTFVKAFSDYLKDYNTLTVNLDPASDPIYKADRDIREFVRTEEVMHRYNLGINGALMKSMDLSLNYIDRLIVKGDFVIYDTPGQMELFLYSKSGVEIANKIAKADWTVCLFIVDAEIASTPENFVSILAQNAVISLRLTIPTITVFNKCDVVDIDPMALIADIGKVEGVLAEIIEKLADFIEYTTVKFRTIKISALKGLGFDEVLSVVNEIFCSCGDIS